MALPPPIKIVYGAFDDDVAAANNAAPPAGFTIGAEPSAKFLDKMRDLAVRLFRPFTHASREAEAGAAPAVIDETTGHPTFERPQTSNYLNPFEIEIEAATRGVPAATVPPELRAAIDEILDPIGHEIRTSQQHALPADAVIGESTAGDFPRATVSLAEFSQPVAPAGRSQGSAPRGAVRRGPQR